ncbi:SMI1/KNR4 family protein [Hymenobacter ruricola]|uniref:SMI1/KNR4 family protein n=1 Tax=Hymenobacter ruricola TaxID=2791023 RepID=A0ABS0I3H6_9BACT|nr:SMI1/KNR4 family protein [Hymenobacter ruricola]MBF9221278.1 SMI1/KNR4 family protein [Hymenobacter ruricola]
MTFDEAFAEIRRFWPGGLPFEFGHGAAAGRLAVEFGRELPAELVTYLDAIAPAEEVDFSTIGNPLYLYGLDRLGVRQDGYNWNSVTNKEILGWPAGFFLLGDEGADPVLIDLDHPGQGIQKRRHGAGNWETGDTLAATIGQFLLCSAALHHALTAFEEDPFVDDERGFNLAPQAAAWLFPRLKTWAGPYYAAWCSDFDNA